MRTLSVLLIGCLCAPLLAVTTSHWTHTSEADFKAGEFQHVVATNLGDIKLSRATQMLLEQDPRISAVYAMVEGPDKTIYAGTGPQGVLLSVKGDTVETAATLDDGTSIFALLVDNDGRLLIGTGGEHGKVLRMDKAGAEPKEIFAAEGVQYIWGLAQTKDGNLYAATGPEGQLYEIKPDGTNRVLFDSNENNLLCLLAAEPDLLYDGTDPNGMVYRVNRKSGEVFVMYDAAESEISALALDGRGNLYAGTAQAGMEMPEGIADMGAAEQVGRPEGGTSGVPIPAEPPEDPAPPDLPDPNPGQPEPIPQDEVDPPKMLIAPLQDDGGGNDDGDGDVGEDEGDSGDGDEDPAPSPDDPAPDPEEPPVAGDDDDDDDAAGDKDEAEVETVVSAPGGTPLGASETGEPAPGGNAIYRIDRDGFVTEIFRMPVLVLSMLAQDGMLLVGTGSEGLVYQINPGADETLVLAKVDPKQVMSLLATSDRRIVLGLANVGGVATMSSGFAADGTFTSPVLDAMQVSRFGNLRLNGTLPAKTKLLVSTRSGNVAEPGDVGWSKWSDEVPASRYLTIGSPAARFFQYRLRMTSEEGATTPVVEEVDVAYQVPNLSPRVTSVQIAASGDASAAAEMAGGAGGGGGGGDSTTALVASPTKTVTWEASDPNSDAMVYTLHFRGSSNGPWILLKEDLTEATFEWNTRSVADGRYEVRVTASDAAVNPRGQGRTASRVSDPIMVDNTPPAVGDIKSNVAGAELRIDLKAVDRTSTVAALDYSVDSNDDWQRVAASDNIFDGPEETASFAISGLAAGQHQVTLRATDAQGNQAFETVVVTIEAPAARR